MRMRKGRKEQWGLEGKDEEKRKKGAQERER